MLGTGIYFQLNLVLFLVKLRVMFMLHFILLVTFHIGCRSTQGSYTPCILLSAILFSYFFYYWSNFNFVLIKLLFRNSQESKTLWFVCEIELKPQAQICELIILRCYPHKKANISRVIIAFILAQKVKVNSQSELDGLFVINTYP